MSSPPSRSIFSGPESPGATAVLVLTALVVLLAGSVLEFYDIALGTGRWYAGMSLKWLGALVAFVVACAAVLMACLVTSWRLSCARTLLHLRGRLGGSRLPIVAILLIGPILLLQHTPWGIVLRGPYLRMLLWALCAGGIAWILSDVDVSVSSAKSMLVAILLSGAAIIVASAFTYVTSYPFSLGWSEGNRLWDYSLMFGKAHYSIDPNHVPVAYLDIGRQIIGGLPFLLPRVSIEGVRAWLALVATVPYWLVGLLAFYPRRPGRSTAWVTASLFGLLFLNQGPIHAPLVLCAILVLIAWRLPITWGAPVLAVAGYFAGASRFTWMFAPSMWALMLELAGAKLKAGHIPIATWRRAVALAAAGLLGSALALGNFLPGMDTSIASSATVSGSQTLLWYRLLPNATYRDGVLLGLLKATGPILVVIVFAWRRYWNRSRIQGSLLVASLVAFMLVGLVVSTKIGGGGDLHNLDMFLIGLLLITALLWQDAGDEWLGDLKSMPRWIHVATILTLVMPAYSALMSLRPISFAADADWISVLVGVDRTRDLGSLPDAATTEARLDSVRAAVADASAKGPVLFMDQRQLLTFGAVDKVDLVGEYEKKRLMDEALSGNSDYFASFYEDLAAGRFGLIVSSPLRTPIKDSQYGFGEENNAWVRWVAKPVLCFYDELDTLNDVKVELLIPREAKSACTSALPGARP